MEWLSANLGTIVVLIILVIIVCLIIRKMVKDKKSGKGICNCGCQGGDCDKCLKKGN